MFFSNVISWPRSMKTCSIHRSVNVSIFCHLLSDFTSDFLGTVPTLSTLQSLDSWGSMVPPHAASIALDQDSLTVTLGIVRDIVTEVATFEEISTSVWSSWVWRKKCFNRVFQGCSSRSPCVWATCGGAPQVSLPGDGVPGRYNCQGKEDLIQIFLAIFFIK